MQCHSLRKSDNVVLKQGECGSLTCCITTYSISTLLIPCITYAQEAPNDKRYHPASTDTSVPCSPPNISTVVVILMSYRFMIRSKCNLSVDL